MRSDKYSFNSVANSGRVWRKGAGKHGLEWYFCCHCLHKFSQICLNQCSTLTCVSVLQTWLRSVYELPKLLFFYEMGKICFGDSSAVQSKESIHFLHNETSLGVCFRVVVLQYLHQCGCKFQGCLSVFIISHQSGVSFRVVTVSWIVNQSGVSFRVVAVS